MEMLSYHNDENLKKLMVLEMKGHVERDQLVKGTYGHTDSDGNLKGCAVGCAIDSINIILGKSYDCTAHEIFEEALGIPEWLAELQDCFFENLTEGECQQFAVEFLEAIPVGINLEPVKWKFCAFLLQENIDTIIKQDNINEKVKEEVISSITAVLHVHETAINTGKFDLEAAKSAESAIWAVWTTAEAESESAVRLAAWAAAWASWASRAPRAVIGVAATSVVWSAIWAAARATESAVLKSYEKYAKELLRLLRSQ